jgi:cholesterol transport system auxiliary component
VRVTRRIAVIGASCLSGCSLVGLQPYTERRDWPLVVRRAVALPPRRNGRTLLVRSVTAAPQLEARGLQWLRPDGSVHADIYEQWAVPPAEAVDDDLRQWLAASGIYTAVLEPGSRLRADLVLEAELDAFVADLPAGVARAALAGVLMDERTSPARVLLQQTFSATAKLASDNIPDLVEALRAALRDVLEQVEKRLAGV